MKDTIYREDAIKAIEDRRCWLTLASQHGDMGRVLWDEYYIKFEDAIEALLLISSADRPQGWIPCNERMPSEKDYIGDVVIWCTDKSIVGVGWYYESTKSWATIDDTFPPILGEVIAWMPLPKPWGGTDDA